MTSTGFQQRFRRRRFGPEAAARFLESLQSIGVHSLRVALENGGDQLLLRAEVTMIDSGGVKIYPRDVEEVAARHSAVLEVAVFGAPDAKWGETPIAAVLAAPGAI